MVLDLDECEFLIYGVPKKAVVRVKVEEIPMANKEHLAWLSSGVSHWNRCKNLLPPGVSPDLSRAYLSEYDLSGIDFSGVNLRKADLSWTNLSGANLSRTNLSEAHCFRTELSDVDLSYANLDKAELTQSRLARANLTMANLRQVKMSDAVLIKAVLSCANLCDADLSMTNLSMADLSDVDLSHANLEKANLSNADLSRADMSYASFHKAKLSGATASEANLSQANLSQATISDAYFCGAKFNDSNLSKSNFSNTNLTGSDLSRVQALGTNFSNALFTGVCLEDWSMNSTTILTNVICNYIYLKSNQKDRRPSSGDFELGGFSQLFEKLSETIDLIFRDGIDWKAFMFSFQELKVQYGEQNLSIQAIEKKTDGAFVIRLNILPNADKAEIEHQAKKLYENELILLEARYHTELLAKNEQITIYRQHNTSLETIIYALADRPIQNIIDITTKAETKIMSETYQSKYDQRGAKIGGIVDTAQPGSSQEFNQHNYAPEYKQTLTAAAAEIQRLLRQLEQTNPDATEIERINYVNDEMTPSLKRRFAGAFQAGSEAAIEEFLDNPYINVGKAIVKGWIKPE